MASSGAEAGGKASKQRVHDASATAASTYAVGRDSTSVHLSTASQSPSPAPASRSEVARAFLRADPDGNGVISRQELREALSDLGYRSVPPAILSVVLPEVTADMDTSIDTVEHGGLTLEQFRAAVKVVALHDTFVGMDADRSGTVDASEVKTFLANQGVNVSDHQVEEMLAKVDADGSADLDFAEFYSCFGRLEEMNERALAMHWMTMTSVDTGSAFSVAPPPKHVSLVRFAIAGTCGGILSRTFTAPLDRLKIVGQTEAVETSMRQAARRIISSQGWRGLFAGNSANILRVLPFGVTSSVAYTHLVRVFPTHDEFHPMEPFYRGIAGACAGALGTFVTYPLDLAKAKLAAEHSPYRTVSGALRGVFAQQGVRGLYSGMGPSLLAVAPFLAVQQSTYDVTRQLLAPYFEPSVPLFVGCGAVAGLVAQTIVHPIDTIRVRMQVSGGATAPTAGHAHGSIAVARTAWQTAKAAVARDGLQVLYNGWLAAALKVAPAVAITLTVRDVMLGRLYGTVK